MESGIIERVKAFMVDRNLTQYAMARELGMAQQTVSKYLNGDTKPSIQFCDALLTTYPELSSEWLMRGAGNMLILQSESMERLKREDGIPLLPIDAMAGALTCEQTVLESECERYVVPMFEGADFLIPVKGSSMSPRFSSGDIVACRRVPLDGLFFQWGQVYVIDTVQGPLLKKIKKGKTDDTVTIISINPEYEPFELKVEDINAVALVIGTLRLE